MNQQRKIAVFAGSFDPFTNGHKAVLDMALPLFDEVIVAIGHNAEKQGFMTVEQRIEYVKTLYRSNPQVRVAGYTSLTVDFCKQQGAQYLIRGLRNASDFQYEQPIAQTNKEIAGIETVFFVTPPEFSHISSSIVRELLSYGADVSKYVPLKITNKAYFF